MEGMSAYQGRDEETKRKVRMKKREVGWEKHETSSLADSFSPLHPSVALNHTYHGSPENTHKHAPTHTYEHTPSACQVLLCPGSSAWGGGLQAVWALTCPLVTHTDVFTHTPGQTVELCVRHALILQPDDERQAAGLLSWCQRAGPDQRALILHPPPLPPPSSSASASFEFFHLFAALIFISNDFQLSDWITEGSCDQQG